MSRLKVKASKRGITVLSWRICYKRALKYQNRIQNIYKISKLWIHDNLLSFIIPTHESTPTIKSFKIDLSKSDYTKSAFPFAKILMNSRYL